jgi:hypothetical protein
VAPKGREEITETNVSDEAFDEAPNQLNLPKKYLSISQVGMYLRCPRQYKHRYVQDLRRPPGVAITLGSSGHAALELTHHHLVDHQCPAKTESVLDCFADKWKELSALIEDWENEDPGKLKDTGIALVRMYNQTVAPTVRPHVDTQNIRGIEKKFEMSVAGVPMLGYIDLIDTNSTFLFSPEEVALMNAEGRSIPSDLQTAIVDFKFKAKSMTQVEVDGSLQLTMYSLATGIHIVRFEQLLKTKIPKIKSVGSVRTRQDHLWLQHVVREVAESISKGSFPPCDPTSWICNAKWCGFWDQCRGKRV